MTQFVLGDGRGLITTGELAAILGRSDVRIFDVSVRLVPAPPGPYRIESGRDAYRDAHIPGAAFLDLAGDLSDPASPLPFTMPPAETLAARLGAAGVGPDCAVVAYATTATMWATRLWWMLRACGLDQVAVLDGGFDKWVAEGRPVEAGEHRYAPAPLSLRPADGAWSDRTDVLSALGRSDTVVLNALSRSAHAGEGRSGYGRPGRIAGSRNAPYAEAFNPDGTFKSDAEQRARYAAEGLSEAGPVICYCGGGISATVNAFALTRLGRTQVSVYDGSLSEWAKDPDLPMETGPERGALITPR